MSFTPATGDVVFTPKDGPLWMEPLIGWAVVVEYIGPDGDRDDDAETYDTEIEPVVLVENRYPMPVGDYLDNRPEPIEWRIELRVA